MSIFQTKAWQRSWWQHWGSTKGFNFLKEGRFQATGLYVDRYFWHGVLPIRCLQFVGTNYRRISTPRSEYHSLISPECDSAGSINELLEFSWSEAVFRDMFANSRDVSALELLADREGWLFRIVAEDTTFWVDTTGDWEGYLLSLGSNTRLRLFNRRKVLEQLGDIDLANAWPKKASVFFQLLNEFHVRRWGRPCFNERSVAFHQDFLSAVTSEGGEPQLSILSCAGKPISVLYNIAFKGCVYNIQAGFEQNFHKKLSVGTLHLGYCIEDAFQRSDIHKFDFLAGGGKNENYKERLATGSQSLVSVMLVRSKLFQFLYRLKSYRNAIAVSDEELYK